MILPGKLAQILYQMADDLDSNPGSRLAAARSLNSILAAMHVPGGWLRVFDFDDTLAVTEGRVHMTHPGTGDTVRMKTPNWRSEPEYGTLMNEGYEQDFRDFLTYLKDPKALKKYPPILQELVKKSRGKTIILTARTKTDAIKNWLKEMHMAEVECIGVGGSTPQQTAQFKADVIEDLMLKEGYRNVQFWDDSGANINAVNALKQKWNSTNLGDPANIQSIRVPKPKSSDVDHSKSYVGDYY